jgi:cysteine desulfurase/selenocysteine lyase
VDAAQSAPHQKTDVQAMGADFVAFSGHKMLGPSGVGVLYGRLDLLESMPPFLGGGSMIRRVTLDGFEPADPPAKFEAGTPPIVPAIGLGAAIDYLQAIGLERIHQYEQHLAAQAHALLEDIGGIRFLGPAPSKKAGIVSFTVEGIHAHDIAQILDRHGVAIRAGHHCAMPLHHRLGISASSRASFYFYNTPAEVERLAAAVRDAQRVLKR